ncbi:MAG: hypothetical protein ACE5OZ_08045 [Candidatus Heimdallarchaeota archaeon]
MGFSYMLDEQAKAKGSGLTCANDITGMKLGYLTLPTNDKGANRTISNRALKLQ